MTKTARDGVMLMPDLSDLFWSASLEELKKGYLYSPESETYQCLICGETFLKGRIYEHDSLLYDAPRAVGLHIKAEHVSMFEFLLGLDKGYTGLTDHQKKMLTYFYRGCNDKEISGELRTSASTVRNHRYNFREKEKQSRIMLAIFELLKEQTSPDKSFVDFHRSAQMVDERYAITMEEYDQVLETHFKQGLDGPLHVFPKKEKKKIVILKHLAQKFAANRTYTEKEVNAILQQVYEDYVTLRRYLIDYGFMGRTRDGGEYWIKK